MLDRHTEKINSIINEGYDFRFGEYISQGFEMLQKQLGNFILFALIYFFISAVVDIIPLQIGSILSNIVIAPIATAGIYIAAHRLHRGEHIELSHFFQGIDKVGPLVLVTLVGTVITLVSMAPFFAVIDLQGLYNWYQEIIANPEVFQEDPDYFFEMPTIPIWAYLLLLPALYFSVAYSFSILFVVFYDMDFWPALESSRKLITKKWFTFFGFSLVMALFMALGLAICCVGLLAALPLMHICYYLAFADITRLNDEPEEGERIEDHLIG